MVGSYRIITTNVKNSTLNAVLASLQEFTQKMEAKTAIQEKLLNLTTPLLQHHQQLQKIEAVYSSLQTSCQLHEANMKKILAENNIPLASPLYAKLTKNLADIVAQAKDIEKHKENLKFPPFSTTWNTQAEEIQNDIQKLPSAEQSTFAIVSKNLKVVVNMLTSKDSDIRKLRANSTKQYSACQTEHTLLTEKIRAKLPNNFGSKEEKSSSSIASPTQSPTNSSDEDSSPTNEPNSAKRSSYIKVY